MVLFKNNLKELMSSLGFTLTDVDFPDPNETETVNLFDFICLINHKIRALDKNLYKAFRKFDRDRNGFISKQELKETIQLISDDNDKGIAERKMSEISKQLTSTYINLDEFSSIVYPNGKI